VSESTSPSIPHPAGKSGGSGPYLVGIGLLAALIAGLLYWKHRSEPEGPAPVASVVNKPPEPAVPLNAPPPPPPEDAVVDAGKAPPSGNAGVTGSGAGPCSAKCAAGTSSPDLGSAIRGTAQSATGCYNRALRTSEVSGKMTVRLQVGSNGSVCNVNIVDDALGSNEVASCVMGRFRGKTFPAPQGGCVTLDVPINFTIKK
jgi:outer membrane biosynthesis protein TonB